MKYVVALVGIFISCMLISPAIFRGVVWGQTTDGTDVIIEVEGCNYDNLCQEKKENTANCPTDCRAPVSGSLQTATYFYQNLTINTTTNSVQIQWESNVGTTTTLSYGESSDLSQGVLKNPSYRTDHLAFISNLKPGTKYYFAIESTDGYGRKQVWPLSSFVTNMIPDMTPPQNPRSLWWLAVPGGIVVHWDNPRDADFSYIRVMRNTDRYHRSPWEGTLVYEGATTSFFDRDVVSGQQYFYTFFAVDASGNKSSGAGLRVVVGAQQRLPGETTPRASGSASVGAGSALFSPDSNLSAQGLPFAITVTQAGIGPAPFRGTIGIKGDLPTIVQLDAGSPTVDEIWLSIKYNDIYIGDYLFGAGPESSGGQYTSIIPPLESRGSYEVTVYQNTDGYISEVAKATLYVSGNAKPTPTGTTPPSRRDYAMTFGTIAIFFLGLFAALKIGLWHKP